MEEYTLPWFLEEFNNGMDVTEYFGSVETFFNLLKRHNLMDQIDPFNKDSDEWQNKYLLWLYENNTPLFYEYTTKMLDNDVELINGELYLVIRDRGDLADLFCDHRDVSQKTIRNILANDSDWFEYYSNTTDDVYSDVIEELNEQNIRRLKEKMIEELGGQELSPETEEMELIATEQGHDDFWILNEENVSRIIDDEESMNSLLDDELNDLKGELYNIHSNAYNSAYESKLYNNVWRELDDYFDVETKKWESRQVMGKPNEFFLVKIRDFETHILNFLNEYDGYSDGKLEYWGSYLGILSQTVECLSVYFSDYPDSDEVEENINAYFRDHI